MIGLLLTGDHFFGDEQVFVDYLTAQLPNSVIVDNVFPYSVLNTGRRALQRFWAWVARKRSWERASVYDVPIIMRNVLQVTIPYSDDVLMSLKTPPGAFETEARLLLAVKLLELGRIATGMAAHLAGVSRVAFVMALDQIVAVVLRRLNRGRIAPCLRPRSAMADLPAPLSAAAIPHTCRWSPSGCCRSASALAASRSAFRC